MIAYTDDIRSIVTAETFREMADSYAEAYGLDTEEGDIQGMIRAADAFDRLDDEFVYWAYVVAILEGIIEDEDGYRGDDYVSSPDILASLLGGDYDLQGSPEALAYARSQMVLAAPHTQGFLDRAALEEDAENFRAGKIDWDDIERMTLLAETAWRNLVA